MKVFLEWFLPRRSRIIGVFLGFLTAVLLMSLGFWRTLLLALLAAVGYFIGLWRDDKEKFLSILEKVKQLRRIFDREA